MGFCANCGAALQDGAAFCNRCGAAQQIPSQDGSQYLQHHPQQHMQQQYLYRQTAPQPPQKKSRKGLIIGLACGGTALVAGLVVLILFLTGVIGGGENTPGAAVVEGSTSDFSATGNTDSPEEDVIYVSSAEEFVEAIHPQANIKINPGYYNLTDFLSRFQSADDWNAWNREHPYVQISDVFDGLEIVIVNVNALTIEGGTDNPADTEIVTDPRYATVLNFIGCNEIELGCLTMGHTDRGNCVGDVLGFDNSSNIHLRSLDLYGCGVYGIGCINYSGDLYVSDSVIRDCEYGPFNIYEGSGDFEFTNCTFSGSDGGGYFEFNSNSRLSFLHCSFGQEESNLWYYDEFGTYEDCEFMEPTYYPER